MATLAVTNKQNELLATTLSARSFMAFKQRMGSGCAVVVDLDCGEEILVDTCKIFRKLPKGAHYKARLLKRVTKVPEGVDAKKHTVWVEV
jgi:hypothetical protein